MELISFFSNKSVKFDKERKKIYSKLLLSKSQEQRLNAELVALKRNIVALSKSGKNTSSEVEEALSLQVRIRHISTVRKACQKDLDSLVAMENASELAQHAKSSSKVVSKKLGRMPQEEDVQADVDSVADAAADAARVSGIFYRTEENENQSDGKEELMQEIANMVEAEKHLDVLQAFAGVSMGKTATEFDIPVNSQRATDGHESLDSRSQNLEKR